MPIFNNLIYKNFSDLIDSSDGFLISIPEYMELRKYILEVAKKYNEKDKDFLELIWLKRTKQGIANTTSNGFSNEEFSKNLTSLHNLTIKIKQNKDYETYKYAIRKLSQWKEKGKIKSIYRAQIARAFATFHPDLFINWVADTEIQKILNIFSEFDDLNLDDVNRKDDWYTISSKIKKAINKSNKSAKKPLDKESLRRLFNEIYLQNSEYDFSGSAEEELCQNQELLKSTTRKSVEATDVKLNESGELKPKFYKWLKEKKSYNKISSEEGYDTGQRVDISMIDIKKKRKILCELKWINDFDFRLKIRMAIGQLLEYQFYDKSDECELWLVLNQKPSKNYIEYLCELKSVITKDFHVYVIDDDGINFKCIV